MTLFLCGDVMTGRGVDQILPHPGSRQIYEPYTQDAQEYIALAEARNGPIPKPVSAAYIWGDGLAVLARLAADARIINLETSVTASDDVWPAKGINYRMHPENIGCLTAAGVDACSLSNNHVLDYGYAGLAETLDTLRRSGVASAGAGRTLAEAQAPAIITLPNGARSLVVSCAVASSGIPEEWAAGPTKAGVDLLPDLSEAVARRLTARIRPLRGPRDLVVASIHWGSNWGYDVPDAHTCFAHWLIDGGVHVVCGHSSHHPQAIERYRGRLILYGCGDLINDYEGIAGYENYRGDLVLMYFPVFSVASGELTALTLVPMQIRKMRLNTPSRTDAEWLRDTLGRVSARYKTTIEFIADGTLAVR